MLKVPLNTNQSINQLRLQHVSTAFDRYSTFRRRLHVFIVCVVKHEMSLCASNTVAVHDCRLLDLVSRCLLALRHFCPDLHDLLLCQVSRRRVFLGHVMSCHIHVGPRNWRHFFVCLNFVRCRPIFKLFSLSESGENLS